MVTIRNIDETFRFYGSFGAKQMDVALISGFGEISMAFAWLRWILRRLKM